MNRTVMVMGILPRQPEYDWFPAVRNETNQLLAALAEGDEKVSFMDFGDQTLDKEGLPSRKCFGGDLLHLNAGGYRVWAEAIAPAVDKLVGSPAAAGEER